MGVVIQLTGTMKYNNPQQQDKIQASGPGQTQECSIETSARQATSLHSI